MRAPSGQAGCSTVALVASIALFLVTVAHGAAVGIRRDSFTGAPREGDPVWTRLHQRLAARAVTLGDTDVAFFGDSITEVGCYASWWLSVFLPTHLLLGLAGGLRRAP